MPLLARALLVVSALALSNTAGVAKTMKDGPKELVGLFADRPEQCLKWSEDEGFRIEFSSGLFKTCDGRICENEIVSHSKIRGGYILNEKNWVQKGKGPTYPQRVKIIGANTIIWVAPKPVTLHRCPEEPQQRYEEPQPVLRLPPEMMKGR